MNFLFSWHSHVFFFNWLENRSSSGSGSSSSSSSASSSASSSGSSSDSEWDLQLQQQNSILFPEISSAVQYRTILVCLFFFHFVPMDFQIDLFVIKGEGDERTNKRRHSKHETSKLISQNETSKLPIFIFFRVDCFDKWRWRGETRLAIADNWTK